MAIKASRIDVWMTIIDDRAGGAAEKLEALAKAGADLEVVFARRTPEQPGQGILFAGPIVDHRHPNIATAHFDRHGCLLL